MRIYPATRVHGRYSMIMLFILSRDIFFCTFTLRYSDRSHFAPYTRLYPVHFPRSKTRNKCKRQMLLRDLVSISRFSSELGFLLTIVVAATYCRIWSEFFRKINRDDTPFDLWQKRATSACKMSLGYYFLWKRKERLNGSGTSHARIRRR